MVEVLRKDYWKRSDAFILPLTGLPEAENQTSYLFWDGYSIEDFQLIVVYEYDNYEKFLGYCRKSIFPILDRNGYLLESYDRKDMTIFVLDISEWAIDINLCLIGKYSKFSRQAKKEIERYHLKNRILPVSVYSVIYPEKELSVLGDSNAIEYVAREYGLNIDELKKIGEIGSLYDRKKETLYLEDDNLTEEVR